MAGRVRTELGPKQTAFLKHFIATGNATEAARLAGYSTANAAKTAMRLKHHPLIVAELEKHKVQSIQHGEYDRQRAMKELDERIARADAVDQHSAVASLMQTKLKLNGLLVEKHQVQQAGFVVHLLLPLLPDQTGEKSE